MLQVDRNNNIKKKETFGKKAELVANWKRREICISRLRQTIMYFYIAFLNSDPPDAAGEQLRSVSELWMADFV